MLEVAIAFVVLFILLFLEVPIAFGMALVGFLGLVHFLEFGPAMAAVGTDAFGQILNAEFAVLPLFIVMGNFIAQSRISNDLYDASNAWLGHTRGGLATATIAACGGFSAVCGSSLATSATMTKVAMPSMRRYGYADSLAAGSIAAGGTLGILIPPSVALVFYGIMTDTDIGKLFAAGFLPGVLGVLGYIGAILVITSWKPELGPRGERTAWMDRIIALRGVWGMLLLFGIVMGGIYAGIFSPTESAGIGAMGALLIGWLKGGLTPGSPRGIWPLLLCLIPGRQKPGLLREGTGFLTAPFRKGGFDWPVIRRVLTESGRTSAALFTILIGSLIFANFINVSGVPTDLADWFTEAKFSPMSVLLLIVVIYLLLGCILESISMMLLTVPVFYPIIKAMDFGLADEEATLIWFGIIVVVVIEISLITPPIGLNVFVLKSLLPEVPVTTIFKGVIPFICADIVRTTLLLLIPWISLVLPSMME